MASDLLTSFFFDYWLDKDGYISITLVRLKSFEELIRSKYFFHLEGLIKKIGNSNAAQRPFIAPNVWPKLNILVTP